MLKRSLSWITAIALIFCLLPSGCSKDLAQQKGLSDTALFARGQQMEEKKKYEDAAEAFQLLVERYPNSPLAPQGQLGLASNLMKQKEAVLAEAAFDDFLRLYPANPKVPDALLLKGDLLYQKILLPGRSQEKTKEAIEVYKQFLEKESDTPRAKTVLSRIKELRVHLLRHEETIISHLLSSKKYESAELRAKRALEEFSDLAPATNLLSMLSKAQEKRAKADEAAQAQKTRDEKSPREGNK